MGANYSSLFVQLDTVNLTKSRWVRQTRCSRGSRKQGGTRAARDIWVGNCCIAVKFAQSEPTFGRRSEAHLSYKHTERQHQRQRPMLANGDASEWVWDRFSNVTIDQHWSLLLTLSVGIPLKTRVWQRCSEIYGVLTCILQLLRVYKSVNFHNTKLWFFTHLFITKGNKSSLT